MITTFQEKVYNATKKIPKGKVTTYKLLADFIGCNSTQAVGQALRRNPYAPKVPCHRVISTTQTIGGFQGKRVGKSICSKLKLLKSEGVLFSNDKLVDPSKIFNY